MKNEEIKENFLLKKKINDIGRWYVNRFVINVSKNTKIKKKLLDAGAGECAYKPLFKHLEYKSIDLGVGDDEWNYDFLDYKGELHNMPIPNDEFDYVLCTQVLEHLELPFESLKDLNRVLKPGGEIFISVPFCQNEHQEPYDFFRYTSYGLKSLLSRSGFKDIVVKPFGGRFMRWAWEAPRILSHLPKIKTKKNKFGIKSIFTIPIYLISLMIVRVFQLIMMYLDKFDKIKDDTLGWECHAVK
ncbi:class I SAM-dependent methyltransferase [Flavobacteriaceae bacterium]|nr:class I SAM-dependent methyltransferase [Flavobacteriaceae bacterium]